MSESGPPLRKMANPDKRGFQTAGYCGEILGADHPVAQKG
jgi:hypothetical protein